MMRARTSLTMILIRPTSIMPQAWIVQANSIAFLAMIGILHRTQLQE